MNTAFPGGPPKLSLREIRRQKPCRAEPLGAADQSLEGPINVIIMADSDIFDDRFWVHVENLYGRRLAAPFADNGAFVSELGRESDGLQRPDFASHARDEQPSVHRRAEDSGAGAGAIPAGSERAQATALRHREPAARAGTRRRRKRFRAIRRHTGGHGADAGTTTGNRSVFRRELSATRNALREVQHNLRKDIDALGCGARIREYRARPDPRGRIRSRFSRS